MAPWALSLLALAVIPSGAAGHQYLRASAPASGDTVAALPAEVRLTFSEPVRLDFSRVVIQGPGGTLRLGTPRRSADDARVLVVPVQGGWHPGEFTLRWTTVGSDGHRTDGMVEFFVPAPGDPEPGRGTSDAVGEPHHDPAVFPESPTFGPRSPAYVGIRALLFMAIVALLGAVALRWVVLPLTGRRSPSQAQALRPGVDRGAARLGVAAAAALVVAALARLWAQSASLFGLAVALDPPRLAHALGLQPWGAGWWLQIGAAILALVGCGLAARSVRGGWALAAPAALVAAVTPALSGHAVAVPERTWLAVPVDAMHVVAAGGWIGSLLALVVVGLPVALALDPERRRGAAAALVHGFSPAALVFTGILVITGAISAWLHVGEFTALWTTPYGRALLLKVGIFLAVALVGAYNFLRVRPALGEGRADPRLRRSGAVELALAVGVLVVTAVLVALPPSAG
jgi:putative copper export protein/methionine-rich copper-binding protein CopC